MSAVTEIQIDDILNIVGGFGPFQWICTLVLCTMVIPAAFQVLITYFIAMKPTWSCIPNSPICRLNGTQESTNVLRCSIPRNQWEFTEPTEFSIVTQFDIYCKQEWLLDLSTGIFFVGAATGALCLGMLADRKGRKFVLFTSLTVLMLTGLASTLSPNIYIFIACRLLAGSFYAGTLAQMIIMVAELVESNRRPFAANSVWVFYSSALCILSLKAYFIRKWKILLVVCTAPYFFVFLFYKQIPESVRWLLVRERKTEVEAIFTRMANINKRTISPNTIRPETPDITYTSSSFKELFQPISFAMKTIIQAYSWFVTSMVYYGLSLAADELGGSMYLNFALVSLMECPGHITGAYFSNRFGRRKTAALPMFLASISCIIIPFIPITGNIKIVRVIFGMLGKYFITMCYSCIYLWSAEIFPTNNRAKGIGFMQMFEMMGGACAPFIAKELQLVNVVAPFMVFGSCAIIGSGLMVFLPETKGRKMD